MNTEVRPPLSTAALHILLALAAEDLHGYAIMQEIARQSDGRYKPGPGVLYDNIQRLNRDGLIRALPPRAGEADPRRRYYRLSASGRKALAAELERLEGVLREGRRRLRAAAAGVS